MTGPPNPGGPDRETSESRESRELEELAALTPEDLQREVLHLRRALASNRRIGAAVGIVMHQLQVDYDDAFARLRRESQNTNTPLAQVAESVVYLRRLWD